MESDPRPQMAEQSESVQHGLTPQRGAKGLREPFALPEPFKEIYDA